MSVTAPENYAQHEPSHSSLLHDGADPVASPIDEKIQPNAQTYPPVAPPNTEPENFNLLLSAALYFLQFVPAFIALAISKAERPFMDHVLYSCIPIVLSITVIVQCLKRKTATHRACHAFTLSLVLSIVTDVALARLYDLRILLLSVVIAIAQVVIPFGMVVFANLVVAPLHRFHKCPSSHDWQNTRNAFWDVLAIKNNAGGGAAVVQGDDIGSSPGPIRLSRFFMSLFFKKSVNTGFSLESSLIPSKHLV
ncbi:hypothetical protein C8J56DRAFT_951986 [Mycena floridula]|nr:hypothetical protein C8J56DRAFT_951986 [Mycena floridula]